MWSREDSRSAVFPSSARALIRARDCGNNNIMRQEEGESERDIEREGNDRRARAVLIQLLNYPGDAPAPRRRRRGLNNEPRALLYKGLLLKLK